MSGGLKGKIKTAVTLLKGGQRDRAFSKAVANNITSMGLFQLLSDKSYLKLIYRLTFGKQLNLKNPVTFNEKLQWLKLYDREPRYTQMVDKYAVKEYIAQTIGQAYVIPTLGVWDSFDEIDFDALPDQFVLKTTHDSGGVIICTQKDRLDRQKAKEKLEKALKRNFFYFGREWPYKAVKPRILAEKYLIDPSFGELRDYKFFCFNGVCKCMKVDFDRFIQHRANYYDPQGNLMDLGEAVCPPQMDRGILLPQTKDQMLRLAQQLSKDIPFLRVDFYDVGGKIYFGELTFFPASGFGAFTEEKWDTILGQWIQLPERN